MLRVQARDTGVPQGIGTVPGLLHEKDRNKAVLAVGLAGGALAVAKKYGPKVVSKVGPLVVNAVKKIF